MKRLITSRYNSRAPKIYWWLCKECSGWLPSVIRFVSYTMYPANVKAPSADIRTSLGLKPKKNLRIDDTSNVTKPPRHMLPSQLKSIFAFGCIAYIDKLVVTAALEQYD